MLAKLKLLFLPFILISAGFVIVYSFLDWALYLNSDMIHLDDDVMKLWLPFALPFVPVFIWINPRLKQLQFKNKRGDPRFAYVMVAVLAIAGPTIVAQNYLESATGKLTSLDKVSAINQAPKTKYYTIRHLFCNRRNTSFHLKAEVTGKNDEHLDFYVYCAVPVLDSFTDSTQKTCPAWFGYEYRKTVSNNLSKDEEVQIFDKFEQESIDDLNKKDLKKFTYLERPGNTSEHKGYLEAIKKSEKYSGENKEEVVLKPIDEPFEERSGSSFGWIFGLFGIGSMLWFIMIAIPKLKDTSEEISEAEENAEEKTSIRDFGSFFIPGKGHYATTLIMDLNILVFLAMVFSGLGFLTFETQDLLAWGADYRPLTEGHSEWWRLFSSMFLHGGILHIAMNMYGLFFVGILLEPVLNRNRFAIIYIVTGLASSFASIYFNDPIVSVGASGAIFGMFGVFFAFLLTKIFPPDFSKSFLSSTIIFIGYNLVIGFTHKGTDNAAHIGGLLSGFVIGLILTSVIKNEMAEKEDKTKFVI